MPTLNPEHDTPGVHRAFAHIPAVDAGDSTIVYPLFYAPFTCKVQKVILIPQDDVSGHDTNRKNLNVLDSGADGDGTTEIGNLDLESGTDLAALDAKEIDVTDTQLTAGDVLSLQIELVSGGVALPTMLAITEYVGD